jgi:hypothetical protein
LVEAIIGGFLVKPGTRRIIAIISFTAGFALLAWLIRWGELILRLPGTELSSDPREILVTIGAAIAGPIAAVFIAAIPNIAASLPFGAAIADGAGHVLGAVWFALAYRFLIFERRPLWSRYLIWAASIGVYYLIMISSGVVLLGLWPEDFAWALGDMRTIEAIGVSLRYILPEALFTVVVTALILSLLPVKYRRPIW